MNTVIQPEQRALEAQNNASFMASLANRADDMAHTARRYAAYGGAVVLSTFSVGGALAGEASAQEQPANPVVPDIWAVVDSARAQGQAQYPNLIDMNWGRADVLNQFVGAAGAGASEDFVKLTIARHGARAFKVDLTQIRGRANIAVDVFRTADDPQGVHGIPVGFNMATSLLVSSYVDARIMRQKGDKYIPWGKKVSLPRPAGLDETNLIGPFHMDGSSPTEYFTRSAIVKARRHSGRLIRSGRLYLETDEYCKLLDPAYDPYGQDCTEVIGNGHQIVHKRQTYIQASRKKPGKTYVSITPQS